MGLSDFSIKSLKSKEGKRTEKADGQGLFIEIQPSGAKIWRYRYGLHGKREKVFLEYPDVMAEVSICPKHPSFPFLRIEFNPAAGYVNSLKMFMDQILPGGYVQLIAHGKCTRIDAAVDVHGIDINDLIVTYPKMRRSKGFYNNGRLETYTLGIKKGETEICVYDKASQIKFLNEKEGTNIPVPTEPVTRIEVRKKKGYPLKDIANLPNFFEGLQIAGYFCPKPIKDEEKFQLFLEVCRSRGGVDALKMISEPTRNLYRNWLKTHQAAWWNPSKVWLGWSVPVAPLL